MASVQRDELLLLGGGAGVVDDLARAQSEQRLIENASVIENLTVASAPRDRACSLPFLFHPLVPLPEPHGNSLGLLWRQREPSRITP